MKEKRSIFRHPRAQIIIGGILLIGLYLYLSYRNGGWQENTAATVVNIIIFGIGLIVWLAFFAQFVLPMRKFSDRQKLFDRLLLYLMEFGTFGLSNIHGPAIFIENGQMPKRQRKRKGKKESEERWPGVVWLDTASAAVLRTPVKFTRVVGPGVIFTNFKETIAGTVDLHTQKHTLGPLDDDDPFAPKKGKQSEAAYHEVQQRRMATSGLTRNAIEVIPSISVMFKIDADEQGHEGGTWFGYNAEAVRKAITGEAIKPEAPTDVAKSHVAWNELPAQLAADIWREYLRKFTLSQLFESLPIPEGRPGANELFMATGGETGLQRIVRMMNERMQYARVEDLDEVGHSTGKEVSSREYTWLNERGIKVIKVKVKNLWLDPKVEEQLVNQWKADWLETARRERDQVERKRSLEIRMGQEEALQEFAELSSDEIADQAVEIGRLVTDTSLGKHEDRLRRARVKSLEVLLHDTFKGTIRDTALQRRINTETRDLAELLQWVRKNS